MHSLHRVWNEHTVPNSEERKADLLPPKMLQIGRPHKIAIEESSDGGSFFDVFRSENMSMKESDVESVDSNRISIGSRMFNYRFN